MRAWIIAFVLMFASSGVAAAERFQVDAANYGLAITSWRDIPFRTVVRQERDFSCGSAALATLLSHHYGRRASEAQVFRAMYDAGDRERIRRRGFSLLDMRAYLEAQGLEADGYRASLDQLAEMNRPAIALIAMNNYRHFVVIKGIRGDRVLVGDPARGLQTYARADFERIWNGIAFLINEDEDAGAFNRADEWRRWSPAPYELSRGQASAAQLTRELPPLYQITDISVLGTLP